MSSTLSDVNGQEMRAIDVFSAGIKYLVDHLMDKCEQRKLGLKKTDIHWILTVPAIWNECAKSLMREAAEQAGILSEQLSLALEPEAASMYCRYLPVHRTQDTHNQVEVTPLPPGKKYLVLDAGGGTADITVHETLKDGSVKEVYKANGGPWGGTCVDQAYSNILEDIFGKAVIDNLKSVKQSAYLEMLREFEIKKRTCSKDMKEKSMKFRIPMELREAYMRLHKVKNYSESSITRPELASDVTFCGDKLLIKKEHILHLFKDTCGEIVGHLKKIFAEERVKGTNIILMVGGFSESEMFQDAIRDNFKGMDFINPHQAGQAVLMGAVIYGHKPGAIASRVARFTFGLKTYQPFNAAVHPEARKVTVEGKDLCGGVFDKHVEIGQEVEVGKCSQPETYSPPSDECPEMAVKIYTSLRKDPQFVDEPDCSFIGSFMVDFSDVKNPNERSAKVKLVYGKTEIGIEAKRATTGDILKAHFRLLD